MLSSKLAVVLSTFFFASRVAGHGLVLGIVANGVWYQGYSPSFQYQKPPPTVIGWSIPQDQDTGFVSDYTNPDIICHKGATPGGTHATVPAGGSVELQWTKWPHPGPIIDYLANCNGDCEKVDKNALKFFKISEAGMISGNPLPAKWASDTLIANNNSWTVTIPKDIAPGNYVLRHEIIALHQSENINGAQNYPQCVNIQVTGGGSANPSGVPGTELYHATDPGILVNIYKTTDTYAIPGPSLYSGAIQISQTMPAAPTASATGPVGGSAAAASSASNASPTSSAAASSVLSSSGSVSSVSTTAAAFYTLPAGAASPSPKKPTTPTSPHAAYSSPSSSLGNSIPSATCCPTATTPDMPLPSGMTLRQLLGWVELAIKRVLDGASLDQPVTQKRRRHARDLNASVLEKRGQCVPCPNGPAASGAATDATSAQTTSSPSSAASSGYTTLSTTASTASAASASSTAKDTASAYAAAFYASPSESSIILTKTEHSHHSPTVSPIADATDATPGVATPSGHHHHPYHCESPGASPIEGPDGTPSPTPTPHAKKECSAMPYGTGSYTYKPKYTASGTPVADGASIGAPTPTAMSGGEYGKRWVQ